MVPLAEWRLVFLCFYCMHRIHTLFCTILLLAVSYLLTDIELNSRIWSTHTHTTYTTVNPSSRNDLWHIWMYSSCFRLKSFGPFFFRLRTLCYFFWFQIRFPPFSSRFLFSFCLDAIVYYSFLATKAIHFGPNAFSTQEKCRFFFLLSFLNFAGHIYVYMPKWVWESHSRSETKHKTRITENGIKLKSRNWNVRATAQLWESLSLYVACVFSVCKWCNGRYPKVNAPKIISFSVRMYTNRNQSEANGTAFPWCAP